VLARKAAVRERVWRELERRRAARFPGAVGRIPNFAGAAEAAERLRGTAAWRRARTLKANPDAPQLPVRQRALEDGKTVFVAVPRLAGAHPFLRLDPGRLRTTPRRAASIGGAARAGRPVQVEELEPVDLVVCGCVAVDASGARLGKGGGFSDLEYALAWEAGLIGPDTVVATTVHELQVLPRNRIPTTAHDFALDLVVTPERVIECRPAAGGRRRGRRARPGVRWDELTPEKIAAIPLLARLAARR
jgi:5-formyltetrahydrofolate cyclo-ligase